VRELRHNMANVKGVSSTDFELAKLT